MIQNISFNNSKYNNKTKKTNNDKIQFSNNIFENKITSAENIKANYNIAFLGKKAIRLGDGYGNIAHVEGDNVIEFGDQKIILKKLLNKYPDGIYTIGRHPSNDIVFSDNKVSRYHLRITKQDDNYTVEDLNSTNGTYIHPVTNSRTTFTSGQETELNHFELELIKKAKENKIGVYGYRSWAKYEYNKIRNINNENIVQNRFLQNIIDIPRIRGIELLKENRWTFRSAQKNHYSANVNLRASLNVINNSNLIYELDRLMKTGEYVVNDTNYKVDNLTPFYYKTSSDASLWYTREDPVSVYFLDKLNPETYMAIRNITAKYRNAPLHNATGEAADWFKIEINPDERLIIPLIKEAKKIDENLAAAIKEDSELGNSYMLSSAQYEAYCKILEMLQ